MKRDTTTLTGDGDMSARHEDGAPEYGDDIRAVPDALAAEAVTVRFGGVAALDQASITAPMGRLVGLIGPNGAGKTTFFDVLTGYRSPRSGRVHFNGVDITTHSAPRRARAGLGRTFQRMELFSSLTVQQNVELAAESYVRAERPTGLLHWPRQRSSADLTAQLAEAAMRDVDLLDLAQTPARALSLGQGRLLEMARCLARQPKMLLLDEQSSGLDTKESRKLGALLSTLVANRGVGILLVEHNMQMVLEVCERITVLDFGRLLFEGTPDEVAASPEVRNAYLGK
jgi:ABC-type branched-subunit amino acid transport system ATPase component